MNLPESLDEVFVFFDDNLLDKKKRGNRHCEQRKEIQIKEKMGRVDYSLKIEGIAAGKQTERRHKKEKAEIKTIPVPHQVENKKRCSEEEKKRSKHNFIGISNEKSV